MAARPNSLFGLWILILQGKKDGWKTLTIAVAEFTAPAARLPWLPETPRDARQPSSLSLFLPHSTNFMILQHTFNGYPANAWVALASVACNQWTLKESRSRVRHSVNIYWMHAWMNGEMNACTNEWNHEWRIMDVSLCTYLHTLPPTLAIATRDLLSGPWWSRFPLCTGPCHRLSPLLEMILSLPQ